MVGPSSASSVVSHVGSAAAGLATTALSAAAATCLHITPTGQEHSPSTSRRAPPRPTSKRTIVE